ncbi:4'-phosphopantetheinyl transferase family protein [Roseivivax isoporae]|uniref:Enterobactin synthase component D n=1 Tax=Roseivivax isoporae LMG 25204 TaxID=1449351 RepID=X7FF38_9RHOB|nr:4'-phosphopantetheinyl transferase superfamily protein [Roseivivax isoporae]ETX30629.1 phosphopantetheinyl transferase [Roseivivax isoporae LMG 25204]
MDGPERQDHDALPADLSALGIASAWLPLDGSAQDRLGVALPPALARAVPKRQGEFRAGRAAASRALAALGLSAGQDMADPWPRFGADRRPVWPEGCLGSLSHTDSRVICAAGRAAAFSAIGIDIERPVAADEAAPLVAQVMDAGEHARAAEVLGEAAFTAVFSAKEALYKALHPRLGRFVGFDEVRATPCDAERLRLDLGPRLARDSGRAAIHARLWHWQGHVATACILRADGRDALAP